MVKKFCIINHFISLLGRGMICDSVENGKGKRSNNKKKVLLVIREEAVTLSIHDMKELNALFLKLQFICIRIQYPILLSIVVLNILPYNFISMIYCSCC